MMRAMILGVMLLLGGPATATPLEARAAQLASANAMERFSAGIAACLAFAERLPELARRADALGYTREEWGGLIDLMREDTRLLLDPPDGFCEVSSEALTMQEAAGLVALAWREARAQAAAPEAWRMSRGQGDCFIGSHPGGSFRLKSSGQDPVCDMAGATGVAVRFLPAIREGRG